MLGEDFASWLAESTPDRKEVGVCFDRRLLSELAAAERELGEVPSAGEGKTNAMLSDPVKKRVTDLRAQVKEKTRVLAFESVGMRRWKQMLSEHPPTEEQSLRFGRLLDHNPETFPAVALAASCTEPGLTVEEAQRLLDELPVGVVDRIWAACLTANVAGSPDPFGVVSDGIRTGATK